VRIGDEALTVADSLPRIDMRHPDGTAFPVGDTPLIRALHGEKSMAWRP
jgi:hypothetical protein